MKLIQGSQVKQPWESVIYEIDCSDRLPSAVTISSVAVVVLDSDEVDQSGTMIEGVPSISGSSVFCELKNGSDGSDYNVRVRLTLSDSQDAEDDFTLYVRERGQT
jgi:hypothetical protein